MDSVRLGHFPDLGSEQDDPEEAQSILPQSITLAIDRGCPAGGVARVDPTAGKGEAPVAGFSQGGPVALLFPVAIPRMHMPQEGRERQLMAGRAFAQSAKPLIALDPVANRGPFESRRQVPRAFGGTSTRRPRFGGAAARNRFGPGRVLGPRPDQAR